MDSPRKSLPIVHLGSRNSKILARGGKEEKKRTKRKINWRTVGTVKIRLVKGYGHRCVFQFIPDTYIYTYQRPSTRKEEKNTRRKKKKKEKKECAQNDR